ncbi:MAG TPA: glycosyltransferase family 2 protein [Chlamydiales bacterium]|nr:glycosyltransferase family 2 protein [Chlamydiales bacterium]
MISVCILAKNASATLEKCLSSLVSFSEVILLDTGSEDMTIEIAKTYPNVKIHTSPFLGFGPLRNLASSIAVNDWILALDSDEILSPSLIHEIQSLVLDADCAYSIPRHNYFQGKWIKGAGWHPDVVVRLYNKKRTCYLRQKVHESVDTQNVRAIPLSSPILHTPYRSYSDFLKKMEHYSTLFAEEHCGKKSSSLYKAVSHSFFAFFKSYFLKKGCLQGGAGFIISLYNAHTAFYKYLKLSEKNFAAKKESRSDEQEKEKGHPPHKKKNIF